VTSLTNVIMTQSVFGQGSKESTLNVLTDGQGKHDIMGKPCVFVGIVVMLGGIHEPRESAIYLEVSPACFPRHIEEGPFVHVS
jgi:hypothetical protein